MFGHVFTGSEYVTAIENQKVDVNHRPYADVRINNCGELVLMKSKANLEFYEGCFVRYTPVPRVSLLGDLLLMHKPEI